MLNPRLHRLVKEIEYRSPFRRTFFPRFQYNYSAPQLCFLCKCIENTRSVEGSIAEIGCSSGHTTLFLNNYMDSQDIQKDYYALDTFRGFVAEDIQFEVDRGNRTSRDSSSFAVNDKRWFDATMRDAHIARVRSIEADVNEYDLTTLGPLSFVLLDVDFYRPMRKALPELYHVLSPNGIIVVDDCDSPDVAYGGSDQAYREFMSEIDELPAVVHGKLGILARDVPLQL